MVKYCVYMGTSFHTTPRSTTDKWSEVFCWYDFFGVCNAESGAVTNNLVLQDFSCHHCTGWDRVMMLSADYQQAHHFSLKSHPVTWCTQSRLYSAYYTLTEDSKWWTTRNQYRAPHIKPFKGTTHFIVAPLGTPLSLFANKTHKYCFCVVQFAQSVLVLWL